MKSDMCETGNRPAMWQIIVENVVEQFIVLNKKKELYCVYDSEVDMIMWILLK